MMKFSKWFLLSSTAFLALVQTASAMPSSDIDRANDINKEIAKIEKNMGKLQSKGDKQAAKGWCDYKANSKANLAYNQENVLRHQLIDLGAQRDAILNPPKHEERHDDRRDDRGGRDDGAIYINGIRLADDAVIVGVYGSNDDQNNANDGNYGKPGQGGYGKPGQGGANDNPKGSVDNDPNTVDNDPNTVDNDPNTVDNDPNTTDPKDPPKKPVHHHKPGKHPGGKPAPHKPTSPNRPKPHKPTNPNRPKPCKPTNPNQPKPGKPGQGGGKPGQGGGKPGQGGNNPNRPKPNGPNEPNVPNVMPPPPKDDGQDEIRREQAQIDYEISLAPVKVRVDRASMKLNKGDGQAKDKIVAIVAGRKYKIKHKIEGSDDDAILEMLKYKYDPAADLKSNRQVYKQISKKLFDQRGQSVTSAPSENQPNDGAVSGSAN